MAPITVTAKNHKTPSDLRRMARRAFLREAIPAVPGNRLGEVITFDADGRPISDESLALHRAAAFAGLAPMPITFRRTVGVSEALSMLPAETRAALLAGADRAAASLTPADLRACACGHCRRGRR